MTIGKEHLLTEEMFITHRPEEIFPLLCPVREYYWIPHWKCTMVHSRSGLVEKGCVFITDFPTETGGPETWLTIEHEPCRRVSFARMNSVRAMRYDIDLAPAKGGTTMTWTQRQYLLPGADIDKPDRDSYAALMGMLRDMLQHYLDTGEALRA